MPNCGQSQEYPRVLIFADSLSAWAVVEVVMNSEPRMRDGME